MDFIRKCFMLVVMAAALTACSGGGDSGGVSSTPTPTAPTNRTLSVEKFGDGQVASTSAPGIDCNNDCSEAYPEGTAVVLTATGSGDYAFASWAGCDTVSGNTCNVTVDSDKSVYPTFAKNLVLTPTTHTLSAATMQLLESQVGTTYYFSDQATELASVQAGDVIVSQSGAGLLRRVLSVTLTNGQYVVETADASLEDVIQEGTFSLQKKLTPADLAPEVQTAAAVVKTAAVITSTFTLQVDQVVYDEDGNAQTKDDQVKLTGSIQVEMELDVAGDYGLTGLKEFKSILTTKTNRSLDLEAGGKVPLFKKEVALKTFYFSPIPVGPVVIVPEITIYAKVNCSSEVSVRTWVSLNTTSSAGARFKKGEGWTPVSSESSKFSYQPPTLTAAAVFKASLGPELKLMIAGVAGPTTSVEGYARLKAGVSDAPWWNLYAGISGTVGGKVEILSWTLASCSLDLFKKEWLLEEWRGDAFSPGTPDTPSGLGANPVSSRQINLTWNDLPDTMAVDGFKIYRDGVYDASTTNNSFSDLGLSAGTKYCYTVSAFTKNGGESAKTSSVCATTTLASDTNAPAAPTGLQAIAISASRIDLSWAAQSGAAGYKIYRNNIPAYSTPLTNVSDTGLTAGTQYCYNVASYDSRGNVSLLSNQVCAATSGGGGAGSSTLPDTGQSGDYTSTFGEDSDYTINPPSYTAYGNGTVTDNVTGLMWQRQDDGVTRIWDDAITYCNNSGLAGYSDWRLPSKKELMSIVNYGRYNPAIDTTAFPNTAASNYWSSTTNAYNTDYAWYVGFSSGYVLSDDLYNNLYARCVRGGQ